MSERPDSETEERPGARRPAPLPVTRFAPSPTGRLHRGHAYSALMAYRAAQESGGRFLLRIEDIDATRCQPEFESAIFEDLAWLGVTWEEPVRRQSRHRQDHEEALQRLQADGVLYRCFRTRREMAAQAQSAPHAHEQPFFGAPLPPAEEAARLLAGEPFAWRLSIQAARERLGDFSGLAFLETGSGPQGETGALLARPDRAGDIVLARKDVGLSYHLAVVVDDALQGVNHVVRGQDLFEAVHAQRLLQALLGLPTPVYRHHSLLVGADGKRYAKRNKSETLAEIRQSGLSAADLRRELGFF